MKRVMQTKFGPVEGNCFAACIASMLEVSIEDVPINCSSAEAAFSTLQTYLKTKNLFFLEVRIDVAKAYPLYEMDGIPCLLSGRSPRYYEGEGVQPVNHCVVGMINSDPTHNNPVIFDAIHDPHPDGTFLKPNTLWGLGFLCKLDPSKP